MLSKKVKEYKRIRQESEISLRRSQVLLSSLRKSFKKDFQESLKDKIRKPAKLRYSEFNFGNKKNNQDAAIIYILNINDAEATVDNVWVDEHGTDVSRVVPFSVEWFDKFCLEQSEKSGIDIRLQKKQNAK